MRRKRSRPLFRPVFAFSLLAVMCASVSAQVAEKKKDSVRFIKPVPLERPGESAPAPAPKPKLPDARSFKSPEATPLTDADKLHLWRVAHKVTTGQGGESGSSFTLPHTQEKGWVAQVAYGNPRSPAASGDVVVVGSGGGNSIYGHEIVTGKRLWTAVSKDAGISSIVIDGDSAYYTTWSCTFERVRVLTGQMVFAKWISPTVDNQPAVADGKAFCSFVGAGGTRLSLHNIESGVEKWSTITGMNPGLQGPVIADKHVFLASNDGTLGCFDAANGKEVWKQPLGLCAPPVFVPGGLLCVTPVEAAPQPEVAKPAPKAEAPKEQPAPGKSASDRDSVVPEKERPEPRQPEAAPLPDNTLIAHGTRRLALFTSKQTPKAAAPLVGPPMGGGLDYQGPAPGYDGEMAFFAVNGCISALALKAGAPQWSVELASSGTRAFTTPVVSGSLVIVGTSDGYVFALSRRSGNLVWSYYFEGHSFAAKPAVGKDRVLITSTKGALIALPTGAAVKEAGNEPRPEAEIARDFKEKRVPGAPEPEPKPAEDGARPPRRPDARPEAEDPPAYTDERSKGEFERAEKRKQEREAAKGKDYEPKKFRRE